MPKKVICPVCKQEVEVLQTSNGDLFAPHFVPLKLEPCPTSELHLASYTQTRGNSEEDLQS